MAPQDQIDRLVKIGHEGFGAIEECYSMVTSGRSAGTTRVHQQPCVYRGPQIFTVTMAPVVANTNEIAYYYGGTGREPVMNCDEAAEYYGGFVISEHGRRIKHFRGA